jgi:hypothetical protein
MSNTDKSTNEPRPDSQEPVRIEMERANPSITNPVTSKSLIDAERKLPKNIIEDLIPSGLTVAESKTKDNKTRFSVYVASCLTQGNPIFGRHKTRSCRVLYLSLSEDTNRFEQRLRDIAESPVSVNLFNLDVITDEEYKGHLFVQRVGAYIKKRRLDVVIIDTLRDAIELSKRSNSRHILEVAESLRRLANDTQTAIIAVHNTNRDTIDENIFQEKSLEAASDNVILLTDTYRDGDHDYLTLHHYGRMFPKKEIYLSSPIDGPGFTQVDSLPIKQSESDLKDKLVLLYQYGLTQNDIAHTLDLSQGYVSKLLKEVDPETSIEQAISHDDIEEFESSDHEFAPQDEDIASDKNEDDNLD